MTPSKEAKILDLVDDLRNEADDIESCGSTEAARCAIVTAARILALMEETE
jgi:hypothetical protein